MGLLSILIFSFRGQEVPASWKAKTLWEGPAKIQRVIVDDIDPKHKGEEIISVTQDGKVVYICESFGEWINNILWVDTGSLTGLAVGELDASHPGKEIIVEGVRGVVELIQHDTKRHQTIYSICGVLLFYIFGCKNSN